MTNDRAFRLVPVAGENVLIDTKDGIARLDCVYKPAPEAQRLWSFLILLRAGIWNSAPCKEEQAVLAHADMDFVVRMAYAHAVPALVRDGIDLLPRGTIEIPESLSSLLDGHVAGVEKGNEAVLKLMDVMSAFWKRNGVDAVVLKGQTLAVMYPHPEHRAPGDIDWYFPGKGNFERALELSESRGAVTLEDGEADYHYTVSGVVVEHHRRWCDISNPFKRRRIASLEARFGCRELSGHNELDPVLFLIQLNAHILKHLLIKGIGWRQLCDLAVAYANFAGSYDAAEYGRALKQLGLYRWARLVGGVLVDYLGLEAHKLPFGPATGNDVHRLAGMITACGNFGSLYGSGMFRAWLEKAGFFARYAPLELFWRPAELAGNRLRQKLKRNR